MGTHEPAIAGYDPLGSLSDECWAKIDTHLRKAHRVLYKDRRGINGEDVSQEYYRQLLRGIYTHLDSQIKWTDISAGYGDYKIIHRFFRDLLEANFFSKIDRLIRRERKRLSDEHLEKIIAIAKGTPRPEPTDYQKAVSAVNTLTLNLNQHSGINDLLTAFDFLKDDEQSVITTLLADEIARQDKILKSLGDLDAFSKLIEERAREPEHLMKVGTQCYTTFMRAESIIYKIAFYFNFYLKKLLRYFTT